MDSTAPRLDLVWLYPAASISGGVGYVSESVLWPGLRKTVYVQLCSAKQGFGLSCLCVWPCINYCISTNYKSDSTCTEPSPKKTFLGLT